MTNSALSKVRDSQHFNTKKVEKQCETPGNSVKHQETVTDTDTFGFQLLSQTLDIFYTTLHNILHQDFYTSWEIFTRATLALLAPFCISDIALMTTLAVL